MTSKTGTKADTGTATGKTEPAGAGGTPAEAMLAEMQRAGLGPLAWMGAAWIDRMGDLSAEVAQFVADRIREDVKTQHEILHCRTVREVQTVQAAFVTRAVEAYATETGRLVDMATEFGQQAEKDSKQS